MRSIKISVLVLTVAAFMVCGCTVSSRRTSHRLLTQKQIVNEWIAKSPKPITYHTLLEKREAGSEIHSDCILVPNNKDISDDDVESFYSPRAPGGPSWCYTIPDIDLKCYMQQGNDAFPVSSCGVTLNLEALIPNELVAEDIYIVMDSLESHYDSGHLYDVGWQNIGKNTFIFNIPPNITGRERYWQVNLYNKNRSDDDRRNSGPLSSEVPEEYKNRHSVQSILRFIQVTDSVNPESLNEEGYSIYSKLLPYPHKEWSE